MIETGDERLSKDNIRAVGFWLAHFLKGEIGEIDPLVLKSALTELGANFDVEEEALSALGQYTNKAKRPGLDAVWGREKVEGYKTWARGYVEEYESETGIRLPALERSGSKTSGMLQFFGELTALAAGQMSFEDFKRYEEARAMNGLYWVMDRDKRVRIKVPTAEKPIRLSSYPPGFPTKAWRFLKTWGKV